MALANTASAQVSIDDFNAGSQVVADAAPAPLTFFGQADGAGILGGERDLTVGSGTGVLGTTTTVDSGVLSFANTPSSQGTLSVIYDGDDDSPVTDLDGLSGEDLTFGGGDAFAFTLLFSDFEVLYSITVTDMSGNTASFADTLPTGVSGSGVDIVSAFADFTGDTVDFSNVGSLSLSLEAQEPAADITIDNFRTVPEPTSIALLMAGGALLARRRRRD